MAQQEKMTNKSLWGYDTMSVSEQLLMFQGSLLPHLPAIQTHKVQAATSSETHVTILTLFSPCILIQLAVLQPTNTLFVFLLHFYPTYVSAVVQPSSRYTSTFTSLVLVRLVIITSSQCFWFL
jgi:hypothetical protein